MKRWFCHPFCCEVDCLKLTIKLNYDVMKIECRNKIVYQHLFLVCAANHNENIFIEIRDGFDIAACNVGCRIVIRKSDCTV